MAFCLITEKEKNVHVLLMLIPQRREVKFSPLVRSVGGGGSMKRDTVKHRASNFIYFFVPIVTSNTLYGLGFLVGCEEKSM